MTTPALPPLEPLELDDDDEVRLVRRLPGPAGAGTAVLVHGWTATADLCWHELFAPLGEHGAVVAADLPGHGSGPRPSHLDLEDLVVDVGRVVAAVEPPVVLVGWSLGGVLALDVARRAPEVVAGVVVAATAATFPGVRRGGTARSVAGRLPLDALPRAGRRWLARRSWGGRDDDRPVQRWALDELTRGNPRLVAQVGVALGRLDARPWLASVDVPVEVLVTGHDAVVPPDDQRALAAALPMARAVEVAVGHGAFVEDPEPVVDAVVAAVGRVRERARPSP